MFDKWLKLPAHYYLHITALSLLIVGISLSNVLMSIGTIWIIANWLIELKFDQKLVRFKNNKSIIAITLMVALMVVSLTWSTDLNYGLKDLLVKLPFITIPLVLGTTKPLKPKAYQFLLYLFFASLTFTTVFNFIRFNLDNYGDIREMAFFISHIRLGGLLCLALFLGIFELINKRIKAWFLLPILIWLLFYLIKSQTLTAYVLLLILSFTTLLFYLKKSKRIIVLSVFIASVFGVSFYLSSEVKHVTIKKQHEIDTQNLVWYTVNGHSYFHDTLTNTTENGNYVWLYICVEECRTEWNKLSDIDYDSTDLKGQPIYGTLFRYMTSKGLRKDSVDLAKLSKEDIRNIEVGKTNYINRSGFKGKLAKTYENYLVYKESKNPNGHSVFQRIEHFKTALHILKTDWFFGIGIGDVNKRFEEQYTIDKSKLTIEHRLRAHNQILTNWISFGLVGLFLTLFLLFYPLLSKNVTFFTIIVSVFMIFSFFTQDFIETQAGVTIFGLFYGLMINKNWNGKVR